MEVNKRKIVESVKRIEGLSCIDMQHFRQLPRNAKLKDMLEAVRSDESHFRGIETDVEKAFNDLTDMLEREINGE